MCVLFPKATATVSFKKYAAPTSVTLLDPSYDPCTCDLTVDSCDPKCCCDPDCTTADIAAENVVCLTKVRPVFEKTVDQWTCKDIYNKPKLDQPDWFPILCIQVLISLKLQRKNRERRILSLFFLI